MKFKGAHILLAGLLLCVVTIARGQVIVVGTGAGAAPQLNAYNALTLTLQTSFLAFASSFSGGVRVATGDLNHDREIQDFVSGAGPGGQPLVSAFNGAPTNALLTNFLAYTSTFTGGVFTACGDINLDGYADIATAPDAGGIPELKVFSGSNGTVLADFFPFNLTTIGMRVAAGDTTGDGRAEIVAAIANEVKIFDGTNRVEIADFFPFAAAQNVFIAVGDVNRDGYGDIVVGQGTGNPSLVAVFNGTNTTLQIASFYAYATNYFGGVRVACADVNRDGYADIITAPGTGMVTQIKAFNATNTASTLFSFQPFGASFTNGAYIAASPQRTVTNMIPSALTLAPTNGALRVSWPLAAGWTLQVSTNLPAGAWTNLSVAPVVPVYDITNPVPPRAFRLRAP